MNKRGSHVGVVISFVIFITFLVFLYLILQPAVNGAKSNSPISNLLKSKLIERMSTNLTTITLKINTEMNPQKECVMFKGFRIEAGLPDDFRLIVKNEFEEISSAYKRDFVDLIIDRKNTGETFFKVYHSSEFEIIDDLPPPPERCYNFLMKGEGYNFGLTRTKKYAFESLIFNETNNYKNNYENLKAELGIPEANEFWFGFELSNSTLIGGNETDVSTDVYSQKFSVQYVDGNASVNYGHLIIKIW